MLLPQGLFIVHCRAAKGINILGYEVSYDLLGPIKSWVTQALSGDNMTNAVKAVTAVVLTVLAVGAVGAAHLTPTTHRKNAVITVITKLDKMSHGAVLEMALQRLLVIGTATLFLTLGKG